MSIVFLLEERSMKEALEGLLPKLLPSDKYRFVVHQGKQDLEKSIPRKLRAWRTPGVRFVVIRDQDCQDCLAVKQTLTDLCRDSGREDTLIRIACHELESWYLGDLAAVERGMKSKNLARLQRKKKYRDPDRLANAAQEIKKLARGYQKLSGSRAIGPHLNPENNSSKSFNVFISGLTRIVSEAKESNS